MKYLDSQEIADLKSKRPEWVKDDSVKACYKCGSTFNVFVRKVKKGIIVLFFFENIKIIIF